MKKIFFLILIFMSSNAWGGKADIDINSLTQNEFRQLSREVGLAVSHKPPVAAGPLGLTGFKVGVDITMNNIDTGASHWKLAAPDMPSTWIIPRLHFQKGLPVDIDVGAYYSKIPESEIWLWGANVKYSLINGDNVMPAVAISGSYSKIEGTHIHMNTQGIDLAVSKKLLLLTPYAGVGQTFIDSASFDSTFKQDKFTEPRMYGGLIMSLGLMDVSVEYESALVTSYSLKLSMGI